MIPLHSLQAHILNAFDSAKTQLLTNMNRRIGSWLLDTSVKETGCGEDQLSVHMLKDRKGTFKRGLSHRPSD